MGGLLISIGPNHGGCLDDTRAKNGLVDPPIGSPLPP